MAPLETSIRRPQAVLSDAAEQKWIRARTAGTAAWAGTTRQYVSPETPATQRQPPHLHLPPWTTALRFPLNSMSCDGVQTTLEAAIGGLTHAHFLVGALFSVLGSCITFVGVGMASVWHRRFQQQITDEDEAVATRLWMGACMLGGLGFVLVLASLSLLPLSVALPLASTGLSAWTWYYAHVVDGHITARDRIGALLIMMGSALTTASANKLDCLVPAAVLRSRLVPNPGPAFVYVVLLAIWLTALASIQIIWSWFHSVSASATISSAPPSITTGSLSLADKAAAFDAALVSAASSSSSHNARSLLQAIIALSQWYARLDRRACHRFVLTL